MRGHRRPGNRPRHQARLEHVHFEVDAAAERGGQAGPQTIDAAVHQGAGAGIEQNEDMTHGDG